ECKKLKLKIILSTQASVSNSKAAEFFYGLGVKRITLARECSLEQIKAIKRKLPKLEIETFIHGAMCVSVSGRCFLSQEIFGKSANRGDCLQPCRRKYLIKDVEEGHELELGEEYVLSPKDLCCVDFIEKLIEAKIDSFKIEGRARSPEYVKVVTEAYREAIDAYHNKRLTNNLKKKLKEKLKTVYNRGFSSGFYLGKPLNEFTRSYGSKATKKKVYLGKVKNYFKKIKVAEIKLEAGNIKLKDMIMIQGPTTGIAEQEVNSIELNHKKIRSAKKGQSIAVKTDKLARENDNVYLIK
ncbi:MAG: U32 family peptidase, partial [Nanoarchaeota archaeon]|nr:U32 family peptidase [Nanoarchaeota archaeon]